MQHSSFLEHYRQIIQTPSISAFDEKIDMSNRAIIDLLASWLADFGFSINIQSVPGTNN
ncbi:MAG: acetylornithine deacetylase, partial [Paraglaciecola sp.]|nr:acetylornithine deacetylase [Paraglaciecola sp.]